MDQKQCLILRPGWMFQAHGAKPASAQTEPRGYYGYPITCPPTYCIALAYGSENIMERVLII
ncbi:predicted protein [Histoplasma mississippiense (nom. inval.)]|uniref:predicted protein n=1 Tax=Ajellomyces capsulatus (strain NAm1 / WU24) TaxID=2059318 RepID=UPI000157BC07|nr:predicted protein [Histoplasma mississippiense (nom. inval.)]EDN05632.1 predicted protein [Histoplasma mississippiense (nom. inval.)]